ncbi:hypothetical protein MMC11_007714 [Xylographa trunciseda]|nr:hypothetical protein [Xylographa trunciseda]
MACRDELLSMVPVRNRKHATNTEHGSKVWKVVYILASLFSFEEWPAQDPGSLEAFSIGEEQSTSIVVAIAWSPVGLARNKRPVLAVLTSNLLLSIWDPGPSPSEASSWTRATIINDNLETYFKLYEAPPDVLRKRRRVRTICWAEGLPRDVTTAQKCEQLLAVLNDNNEIVIFDVSSPYTCRQEGWTAEILSHKSITSRSHKLHSSGHEIAWSSWTTKRDAVDALVSCKIGVDYTIFRISIKTSMVVDIQKDSHGTAPLSPNFVITLEEGDDFPELAGPKHSMLCDSKSYMSSSPWDVVSGRCCFEDYFCITTHLSQMEKFQIQSQVDLSGATSEVLTRSDRIWNLEKRQSECREQFAAEHNLGKMTSIKTWGLASLGAYIAACVTIHPSAMVEYSMSSSEKSTIIFGHAATLREKRKGEDEDEKLVFPWELEPRLRDPPSAHATPWSMILGDTTSATLCRRVVEHAMKAPIITVLETLARSMKTNLHIEIESLGSPEIASGDHAKIVELVNSFVKLRSVSEAETSSNQRLLEYCKIPECSRPLFCTSSMYKVRCSIGHIWNRCALSFLAIQEPGTSKFCDTCGREYLNEIQLLQEDVEVTPALVATSNNAQDLESEVPPSIESDTPPTRPSRISLSMTSRYSTTIVPGAHSPTSSIEAQIDNLAPDISDGETSPHTFTAPFPLTSLPRSPSLSSGSVYPEGSTNGIISPRRPTLSEEREVILIKDAEPSNAIATARRVEEINTATDEKPTNGTAADTALSPVSIRSGRSLRSAASELAAARRRSSVINVARAENASKIEGLGLFSNRDPEADNNAADVDGTSEGEMGNDDTQGLEDAVIAAAQQAQMNRPRMVFHGPKRSMRAKKAAQVLGESYEMMRREQGGIVVPPSEDREELEAGADKQQEQEPAEFDDIPLVASSGDENLAEDIDRREVAQENSSKMFPFINALRAHPPDTSIIPKRAATVPSRPRRKTTFSTPPVVDTQSGKKFERESVLNTPYPGKGMGFPPRDQDKHSEALLDLESHAQRFKPTKGNRDQIEVVVVLHSHGGSSTRVGRLVIPPLESFEPRAILKPALKSTENRASVSRGSAIAAAFSFRSQDSGSSITLFDDEAFSRKLLSEYRKLRGRWRILLGARSLRAARLVIYSHPYELFAVSGRADADHFFQPTYSLSGSAWKDVAAVESRRLHLLKQYISSPKKAAGKDEVVQWLRQLCGKGEADAERVAVNFVEDWDVRRLSIAIICVLVLSVAAALLWIFLGVDTITVVGQSLGNGNMGSPVLQKEMLSQGVAGRIEGGLLLGTLVLLLGWTGVSGWAVLSWLTM